MFGFALFVILIIQDPFEPCGPLDLQEGFISPPSPILQCQPALRKATLSGLLFPIPPSSPSSSIFTFILRIFLSFAFCEMQDVGYWLLGDKAGSQGDSVVSLTTRLGQPQMNNLLSAVGGKGGLFWALQSVCVGVWGWKWYPLRVIANLSTPGFLAWPEYTEPGEQWAGG